MTPEQAAALRKPFDASSIGKLPRITCKACRENKMGGTCAQHERKVKCRECGNYITPSHLHLDYVGHAEITDRLLMVDSEWTWEPVAFGSDGLPALTREGGLWIRLTVVGVTRLGFGHADGKTGPDAVKESIGDALRNAAMRFGVGLDLWGATYKGEDHDDEPEASEWVENDAQAAVYAGLLADIESAADEPAVMDHGTAIRRAKAEGSITPMQYERLGRRASERIAEFRMGATA